MPTRLTLDEAAALKWASDWTGGRSAPRGVYGTTLWDLVHRGLLAYRPNIHHKRLAGGGETVCNEFRTTDTGRAALDADATTEGWQMGLYTDAVRKGLPRALGRNATMRSVFGTEGESALVRVKVPVLGSVRFHKLVAPALRGVMQDLVDLDLEGLVDRADFGGTYCYRKARGSSLFSPHAWGVALDLNIHHLALKSGTEVRSVNRINYKCARWEVAPSLKRLAYLFHRWGFAWGGDWDDAYLDPMHFEATDVTVKILRGQALPSAFVARMEKDGKVPGPARLTKR